MTEQEYINVEALGTIRAAISTLRGIIPEMLPETIKKGEAKKVMGTLWEWQERLSNQIEIDQ